MLKLRKIRLNKPNIRKFSGVKHGEISAKDLQAIKKDKNFWTVAKMLEGGGIKP